MAKQLFFKNEDHKREFEKNIYNENDPYYLTAIYLLSSLGKNFKKEWYKDPEDNYIEFEKMYKNTDFSSTQRRVFAFAVEMFNESHFLISDDILDENGEELKIKKAVLKRFSIFDLGYFDEDNFKIFLQALAIKNTTINKFIQL